MKKLVAILAFAASGAFAQGSNCGPTEEVFTALEKQAKEKPIFVAKNDEDVFLTVWFNSETKEGTIVKTSISRKLSCVMDTFTHGKVVGNL